jgi:hypothetical protein
MLAGSENSAETGCPLAAVGSSGGRAAAWFRCMPAPLSRTEDEAGGLGIGFDFSGGGGSLLRGVETGTLELEVADLDPDFGVGGAGRLGSFFQIAAGTKLSGPP